MVRSGCQKKERSALVFEVGLGGAMWCLVGAGDGYSFGGLLLNQNL